MFNSKEQINNKDYPAVYEAIKALGNWAKVTESNWYVNSNYSADDAAQKVRAAMDNDDKLIVVDAKNNSASWYNLLPAVSNHLQNEWNK